MKPETRALLALYDEPDAFEAPAYFDYFEIELRAKEVARCLKEDGFCLTFEGAAYYQDASFSMALLFHDDEQSNCQFLDQPTIRFSNFGNLASITSSGRIPESVQIKIINALRKYGFIFIAEEELDCPYDGAMCDEKMFSSWWVRYFDWI